MSSLSLFVLPVLKHKRGNRNHRYGTHKMFPFIPLSTNPNHNHPFYQFGFDLVVNGAITASIDYVKDSPGIKLMKSITLQIVDEDKIEYLGREKDDVIAMWERYGQISLDKDMTTAIFTGNTAKEIESWTKAVLYVTQPSLSTTVLKEYHPEKVFNPYKNPYSFETIPDGEKLGWINRDRNIRDFTNDLDLRIAQRYTNELSTMYNNKLNMKPVFERGTRFNNKENLEFMKSATTSIEEAIFKLYIYKVQISSWSLRGEIGEIGIASAKVRDYLQRVIRKSRKYS